MREFNYRTEFRITWTAFCIVLIAFASFSLTWAVRFQFAATTWNSAEAIVFLVVVVSLVCGNLLFLLARIGYLRRRACHAPTPRDHLNSIYDRSAAPLGILIPSYKEEKRVLFQTILSTALMEYPNRRIVVLLDDPPDATGQELTALVAARELVQSLQTIFLTRSQRAVQQRLEFLERAKSGQIDYEAETELIASRYEDLADWITNWEARILEDSAETTAHTDRLFIQLILANPAEEHRARARRLRNLPLPVDGLAREYHRLVALQTAEISSFERKRYMNLSHAANKAMNLNTYIALIGASYREVARPDGLHLVMSSANQETLQVPKFEYLLTIDADSFVLPDYALRLIEVLDSDPRIAIAQAPYSSVQGSMAPLERIAGATTDIQYIVHQGFTCFGATYWVGANAMLRLEAIWELRHEVEERGYRVPIFIQDKTVIEDTGSTVDLIRKGWQLYNYPDRLAYSATPPDFGSLIIQRRRWSNGGLIILPALLQYLLSARKGDGVVSEAALRIHYLCSPAITNLAVLVLLIYRFPDDLATIWLPLMAVPYFLVYARDLQYAGFRWGDLPLVCALNFLLMPVNLTGVARSLQQIITGRKAPFGRTPKISGRTATPLFYILFHGTLLAYLVGCSLLDLREGLYLHAGYAAASAAFAIYAISRFVRWREARIDLLTGLLYRWRALKGSLGLPLADRRQSTASVG